MTPFKATAVTKFTRTELKYHRSWWQKFLKWWLKEKDIPTYVYEVEIHTDHLDIQRSDIVLTNDEDLKLHVLWALTTVRLRTLAPTDKWLTIKYFKTTDYVIVGRRFREGRD